MTRTWAPVCGEWGCHSKNQNPITVGDSPGWGVYGGLRFSFPKMWCLWLLHWGSELSFRQCWASSSSVLARGAWWGDDPFFCLPPPPDAAFYCSAGAYLGLSQSFGHTAWFQKFVYLEDWSSVTWSAEKQSESLLIFHGIYYAPLSTPLWFTITVDILEGVTDSSYSRQLFRSFFHL